MPRMICVNCERQYKPKTIGVLFLDMAYDPPVPVRFTSADIYSCPGCGHEIVSGMGELQYDEDRMKHEIKTAAENGRQVILGFENASQRSKYFETF